ncbi:MAG: extracellular solute-binding protein [Spirochaetes bacterium]|nr:extracellular solute-binding protein [Spirochaetota bacterium]
MKKILDLLRKNFGILAIVIAFVAAAITVFLNQRVDEEAFHVVKAGETLASIAKSYNTSVDVLCGENYPDVQQGDTLKPGMSIKLPRSARANTVTIRIAHWQLEPGCRDGINYMIKEYQKLHPNVKIIQNTVPESTYGQWFITQMLGGTAPDLIECALGVPYNLLVGYYMRYFTPLTDYMMSPNPYNENNEFKGVALRDTAKDGFKNCYNADVQEYMTVGLSMHMVRIYYNKDLLLKLTGRTNAPASWSDFLAVCEMIKKERYINKKTGDDLAQLRKAVSNARGDAALAEAKKKLADYELTVTPYVPIANSSYHMNWLEGAFFNVMTSKARDRIDFNHDCSVSAAEQYIGFKTGLVDMNYPPYRSRFAMVAQLASNSMQGFTGLKRDDAVLMFVQGRSVFIVTGTWDAQTLAEQAKDNGFTVGVMDFPYPDKNSPELYKDFLGPSFEDPGMGFPFGCPTPESAPERKRYAIDFLLFMASKENNNKLNEIIGWIPSIRGATATGVLKYFQPHVDGVVGGWNISLGGESTIKWQQVYAMYQVGQMSYDDMCKDFVPYYLDRGYNDYMIVNKNWRRSIINDEKLQTMMRVKMFSATNEAKRAEYAAKYRYVMLRFTREVDVSYERSLLSRVATGGGQIQPAFNYSAEAKARLGLK